MLVGDRDPFARRIPKRAHKFDSHRQLHNSRQLDRAYTAKLRKFMLNMDRFGPYDLKMT